MYCPTSYVDLTLLEYFRNNEVDIEREDRDDWESERRKKKRTIGHDLGSLIKRVKSFTYRPS